MFLPSPLPLISDASESNLLHVNAKWKNEQGRISKVTCKKKLMEECEVWILSFIIDNGTER